MVVRPRHDSQIEFFLLESVGSNLAEISILVGEVKGVIGDRHLDPLILLHFLHCLLFAPLLRKALVGVRNEPFGDEIEKIKLFGILFRGSRVDVHALGRNSDVQGSLRCFVQGQRQSAAVQLDLALREIGEVGFGFDLVPP